VIALWTGGGIVLVQLSLAVGDFLHRKADSPAPTGLNPPESALHLEARLMQQSGEISALGSRSAVSFLQQRGSFARRKQKQSRSKCRQTRAVGLALSSHRLSWGQGSALTSRAKAKQITLNQEVLEKAWGYTSGNVARCWGTWPWNLAAKA
jgi:hypothetical protein